MSYLCFLWEVSIAILRTHESIIFQRVRLANKRAFGCTLHLGESISICSAYIAGKPEVFFLSFVWRWRSHSQLLKIRWCIKPSIHPSVSIWPTALPTSVPSESPSSLPSSVPSGQSTLSPSSVPSEAPTIAPSTAPSIQPSSVPSSNPSAQPSVSPSDRPSASPSSEPSESPSAVPSKSPSTVPSALPSSHPSSVPSASPTSQPSAVPSLEPSSPPSEHPRYVDWISIEQNYCPSSRETNILLFCSSACPFGQQARPRKHHQCLRSHRILLRLLRRWVDVA